MDTEGPMDAVVPMDTGEVVNAPRDHWWRWMIAITALGFLIRLAFVIFIARFDEPAGDQLFYSAQALTNAEGRWFEQPFDRGQPAADHPPMTSLLLTPVSWLAAHLPDLGISAVNLQRLFMALFGSIGIVVMGVIGRVVGGAPVGLFAAGITAIYANIWVNDGLLMAETPTFVVVSLLTLVALRHRRQPQTRTALVLGGLAGLAALSRPELVVILPLLIFFGWSLRSSLPHCSRYALRFGMALVVAWMVVVLPWVVWNNARFSAPVFLSTNDGLTLAGGHCDRTYYDDVGGWDIWCAYATVVPDGEDASQASQRMRSDGLSYWRNNLDRYPVVAGARLARVLSFGYLGANAEAARAEGRPIWISHLATVQYWLLIPAAVLGWRRVTSPTDRWLLTAALPVVVVVAVVANAYVRFRLPAEIGLVVLAALGLRVRVTGFEWSRLGLGVRRGSTSASASSASPPTHSGSGPSRGSPVKNLAAMQPPWHES